MLKEKLIRGNKCNRNTWNIVDGAEGSVVIKEYVINHYIDDELDAFYQLEEEFQFYYIEYAKKGQLESYKKGAERTEPKVYNYLMKATTSNN